MVSNKECRKSKCVWSRIGRLLVVIGGLNWGIVGIGMLFGTMHDMSWNVVHMLLGPWPVVEGLVYLLVGVAALFKIFHCHCKKCSACVCAVHGAGMDGKMGGAPGASAPMGSSMQ